MIETVWPAPLCVMPVTLSIRDPEAWTSSINSAEPSLSSEKELMSAIGLQPVLYHVSAAIRSSLEQNVHYLADELDFVSLHILDGQDIQFRQEV